MDGVSLDSAPFGALTMWEAVTVALALPLLYLIGHVYWRWAAWAASTLVWAWAALSEKAAHSTRETLP
jgi:hypothetical protein